MLDASVLEASPSEQQGEEDSHEPHKECSRENLEVSNYFWRFVAHSLCMHAHELEENDLRSVSEQLGSGETISPTMNAMQVSMIIPMNDFSGSASRHSRKILNIFFSLGSLGRSLFTAIVFAMDRRSTSCSSFSWAIGAAEAAIGNGFWSDDPTLASRSVGGCGYGGSSTASSVLTDGDGISDVVRIPV